MLMIVAVITAAACMQAAGGLDLMVRGAEHLLRKRPAQITFLSPLVTYFFSFVAGTGHVAYSVLPVIAEVARETKIRPERPLGIAVIASQQAITASPISAATVALLGLLTGFNISLLDILIITIPSTLCGVFLGALYSLRVGKELVDDPEYQRRLKEGLLDNSHYELKDIGNKHKALLSVSYLCDCHCFHSLSSGLSDNLRPSHIIDGKTGSLSIWLLLFEILMLSAAALILLFTKANGIKAAQGSVFSAGMQARLSRSSVSLGWVILSYKEI